MIIASAPIQAIHVYAQLNSLKNHLEYVLSCHVCGRRDSFSVNVVCKKSPQNNFKSIYGLIFVNVFIHGHCYILCTFIIARPRVIYKVVNVRNLQLILEKEYFSPYIA